MLDLFTIFTKGGIVLWCFRNTKEFFAPPVNALIRNVLMQVSIAKVKVHWANSIRMCVVTGTLTFRSVQAAAPMTTTT